jgi:A/G-specific adenine glycosylase
MKKRAAKADPAKVRAFRKAVWDFYRRQGRHALPWRQTRNAYRILVSEVMLQQTQVERVIAYYERFVADYPTPAALAAAPLADVLTRWQGLGYNRRAKMLWEGMKEVAAKHGGKLPKTAAELEALRGIGPYTARAVAAFAHDADDVFIETNIRTAVIHHFHPKKLKVSDADIADALAAALPKGRAREWYWALMDYGSYLKRSGVKNNYRAKAYAKQSAFEGSYRQARGAALRALARGAQPSALLVELMGPARRVQMKSALASLLKEGMIELAPGGFRLPR